MKCEYFLNRWILACVLVWAGGNAAAAADQVPGAGRAADAPRPRICLALGGGGARGMAHVGVLRALQAMHVPVDCVAGTSIGAVVGSLLAVGMSVEEIERITLTTDWDAMFSDRPPRREMSFRRRQDELAQSVTFDIGVGKNGLKLPRGLIQGQNLLVFLRNLSQDYALEKDFDRLPVPYRAVATDIETGESVIIGHGDLPRAVRASMAVPAIFSPAEVDGRWLVDGGLFANVPVDAAKSMGADVIIAVDVGFPPYTRKGLNSALEIADQTVTLMMRKGTQAQLAKLGDRDVIIVPQLGDLSSTAFDSAPELIRIGESAAMSMAPSLARYSVSADEYAALVARRTHRSPATELPVVRQISVTADAKMSDAAILAWLHQRVGSPLDIVSLERDMQRIYGLGVFEVVDYSLTPADDGADLWVGATQKSWGPNFLKFGIHVEQVFDGDSQLSLGARYTMTQVNGLEAEWRNDLVVGSNGRIFSEFYQPLNYGSPYFVAVAVHATQNILTIFDPGATDAVGEVRYRNLGLNLDLGKETYSLGEIRLGLQWGKSQRRLRIGDPADPRLADADTRIGEVVLGIEHDSFDQVPFARDGTLASVSVAASRTALGATSQFERYALKYLSAWSSGPYTATVGFEWADYQHISGDTVEPFALGGFLRLSGLNRNELTGNELALGKVIVMRRLDAMSFGSVPLYLGGSLELGNTWQDGAQVQLSNALWSGSTFLAADTFLGPVYIGGGFTEGGRRTFYLAIGYQY